MNLTKHMSLALILIGGCLVGCAGKNGSGLTPRDTLVVLQEGKARGHLVVTTGGSPLAIGSKQVFFAGPENASLSFDGNVDFATDEPLELTDTLAPPPDETALKEE